MKIGAQETYSIAASKSVKFVDTSMQIKIFNYPSHEFLFPTNLSQIGDINILGPLVQLKSLSTSYFFCF